MGIDGAGPSSLEMEIDTQNKNESSPIVENTVENMSPYEREKIETTLLDAENLAKQIRTYLAAVDFATRNGVEIEDKADLSGIRQPGALFEPGRKDGLIAMKIVFEQAIRSVQYSIPERLNKEFSTFTNEH